MFVKKTLNINQKEFEIFYNRINNSLLLKYLSISDLGIQINAMLYHFCKSI